MEKNFKCLSVLKGMTFWIETVHQMHNTTNEKQLPCEISEHGEQRKDLKASREKEQITKVRHQNDFRFPKKPEAHPW